MINPFKQAEMQRLQEERQRETDYSMTMGLATAQASVVDEQSMQIRKDVLVQLSQWQQDRTDAMKSLFLKLCGYYYDEKEKKLKPQKWDRGYVTIFGAQKLVNFIEPLDRNVMLANWSDKVLLLTMKEAICHPLRRFIFLNHIELGLNLSQAEYVFWLIINTVEPTYWRGWNDGERRKDKEIIKVQELRNPYYQQKKKGVFGIET